MKHFAILLSGLLSLFSLSAGAQVLTDERALIRFDHGLGFNAPDTSFGLNIRFRVQNRLALTTVDERDLSIRETEVRISRLRLRFDGYINGSKITYLFQLGFSRDDVSGNPSGLPNLIRDAIVFYRFNPDFYIGFGQAKLPGNRQEIISSGQQQFVDRSVVTSAFDLNRDFGLFAYYTLHPGHALVNLKAAVSSGEGRNYGKNDAGLSYTGRVEVLPFGKFRNNGDFSEGDLSRESSPRLAIGIACSFNQAAIRTNGQTGSLLLRPRDLTSVFGDVLVKYKGNALFLEYGSRNTDHPLTYDADDVMAVQTGYAFNTQFSHLFPSDYELVFRYAGLVSEEKVKDFYPDRTFMTLGLNKYIHDHMTKLQANLTYRSSGQEPLGNDFFLQVQVELGI